MTWRNLFVRRSIEAPRAPAVKAARAGQPASGAFITPQTLTSFAGASTIIGVATRVCLVFWDKADGHLVAGIAALVMGVVVFIINVSDPDARPSDGRSWFIASVVGVVNTLYLVAVALGVFEALAGTEGGGTGTPPPAGS